MVIREVKQGERKGSQFLGCSSYPRCRFTKEIKQEIIKQLWEILISDNNVDLYESNLMRRICGLIYFSDKESGEIKMSLMKS